MAYMSESEFAAAIRPNQAGSSTGGVMKSTVEMTARSSERRYTAASSLVSKPTSRLGSVEAGRSLSAADRTVGPILAAHPQVLARPVSVFFFAKLNIRFLQDLKRSKFASQDIYKANSLIAQVVWKYFEEITNMVNR
jgi:hypothetical protein